MGCGASSQTAAVVPLGKDEGELIDWNEKPQMGVPPGLSTDPLKLNWDNIIVHLQRAENLPSNDWIGSADAYVKCSVEVKAGLAASGPIDGGVKNVNRCQFTAKSNTASPVWDRQHMLCYSVAAGTSPEAFEVRVELLDKNTVMQDSKIALETLPVPAAGAGWQQHTLATSGGGRLHLALKSVRDHYFQTKDYEALGLREKLLISRGSDGPKSQASVAYKCKEGNSKMVLMLPGRCDCFSAPHVARAFMERGFDFFHLDYRGVGRARKFLEDELFNSHSEDMDEYFEDIQGTLKFIESRGVDYKHKVWMGHSTGGTIITAFILRNKLKDTAFTHLVMNSPFLDWGAISPLAELFIENVSGFISGTSGGRTPLPSKTGSHTMNQWHFKAWSLYRMRPVDRPIYITPHVTAGWAKAVTKAQSDLQSAKGKVTNKPVFCITSESDDILDYKETLERIKWFGSNVTVEQLKYNAHDVFVSPELEASNEALERTMAWIEAQTKG